MCIETKKQVLIYLFIFSCPVLKELDLDALSKSFLRLELSSCAVGCLLMAVTTQEDKIKVKHSFCFIKHS